MKSIQLQWKVKYTDQINSMKNGILSELKVVFNLNEYNNYTIPRVMLNYLKITVALCKRLEKCVISCPFIRG